VLGAGASPAAIALLYLALPAALFGPATVLMGFSFPILQRAVQDDPRTSGRKVGILQAANIGGCVAGSIVVGLVLLEWLGTAGTLRLLMGVGLIFAFVGARHEGPRSVFIPLGASLAALIALLPSQQALWLRLHGQKGGFALFGEDASGLVAITAQRAGYRMSLNGRIISSLPFGGVHTWLGVLPALIHPSPRDVALVGLGSGDTAWAVGCRPETRHVTVFEIARPQVRLLETLAAGPSAPAKLLYFLRDPRYRIMFADGRMALERQGLLYDIIEMDPLFPFGSYSGNLYSLEFFKQCATRLKPGGLVCAWAPTRRSAATFVAAFPYVLSFVDGAILVGSVDPLVIDTEAWATRLDAPAVRAYLFSTTADAPLKPLLKCERVGPSSLATIC
jgi:spermidine synthase